VEFELIRLLIGGGLLLFGRKLFWVFIGAAGFLGGLSAGQSLLENQPFWYAWVMGGVCAIILVMLVKLLKNIAFGIGGFILGAYLANGFLEILHLDVGTLQWLILLAAGAMGAILMLTLFEWALVILSSTVGALLISQSIPLDPPASQIIFFGLIILGIMIQIRHEKPHGFQKTIPPRPEDGMQGTIS